MKHYTYTGTVTKIRILTFEEAPLVRFTLCFKEHQLNCLIRIHALTFLAEVDQGTRLTVSGYFNQRQQFVVKKHQLRSQSLLINTFKHSLYPRQKLLK
ncbi:hypothetical protein ACSFB8_02195 [Enterococcus faecalis]